MLTEVLERATVVAVGPGQTPWARAFPPHTGTFVVVHLHRDLGAGKTTLARGLLRAFGVTGPVRSPTYTLVELYDIPAAAGPGALTTAAPTTGAPAAGALTVVHLDLYRLADPSELEPLGLSEWAQPGHLWLAEWPERGGDRLPPADLHITLTAGPDGHSIEALAATPLGDTWLARLSP